MNLLPHLAGKQLEHFIVNFKQQFTDFQDGMDRCKNIAIDSSNRI